MSQQGVLEQLPGAIAKAENLPSPPTVAVEILRLSNDENASVESLAKVISRDPVLSAKLLKLANSSVFRRGSEVTSLDNAAMRLGMKTVKLMALSFSLANELPRKGETSGHVQELVEMSLDCDGDAVLLKVRQTGPACHTGHRSCFHK